MPEPLIETVLPETKAVMEIFEDPLPDLKATSWMMPVFDSTCACTIVSTDPKGDKTEAAYNRAAHLDRRRELATEWAALILEDARPAEALLGGLRKRG